MLIFFIIIQLIFEKISFANMLFYSEILSLIKAVLKILIITHFFHEKYESKWGNLLEYTIANNSFSYNPNCSIIKFRVFFFPFLKSCLKAIDDVFSLNSKRLPIHRACIIHMNKWIKEDYSITSQTVLKL